MQTRNFGIEFGVVRNEFCFGESLLQDGVSAVGDEELAGLVQDRSAMPVALGDFREGAEDIDFRDRGGGFLEFGKAGDDAPTEIGEKFGLKLLRAFFCPEHLVFHFFERRCDVALGVAHGLFPSIVVGNFGEMGSRDFDEIAEDVVEFDLQ